jgi:predicted Zn-dependent protease
LEFSEVCSACDAEFKINFVSYTHSHHSGGDCQSFDGPLGVLAHAYSPLDGSIHFDESEDYTEHTQSGINLRLVAAHEIGHALGLDHSFESNSIMYPFYNGYIDQTSFKLSQDDINRIQSLYGRKNEE